MPRLRSVGNRRPGLSQGGGSNSSAHQASPNRAHGTLLPHHQITRSLTAAHLAAHPNRHVLISGKTALEVRARHQELSHLEPAAARRQHRTDPARPGAPRSADRPRGPAAPGPGVRPVPHASRYTLIACDLLADRAGQNADAASWLVMDRGWRCTTSKRSSGMKATEQPSGTLTSRLRRMTRWCSPGRGVTRHR